MSTLHLFSWLHCFLLSILVSNAQFNQYTESIGPNKESIWQSTSDFVPVQGQSFGEVMIGYQMYMEFDFIFHGRTNHPSNNKYEMFFRVGFDSVLGNSCNGQGSRYPSLWIRDNADILHLSCSSSTSCQPSQSLTDYGILNKGISHHVVISYNDSLLTIHVSGGGKANYTQSWSRASTFSHHVRSVVPVWWMSTKFGTSQYNLGNGTFSNIKIIFSDFGTTTSLPTLEPSTRPTELPTFNPSTVPTQNPTAEPTMKPTTNPTVNPTNEPTVEPSSSPVRPPISVVDDDDDDQNDDDNDEEGLSSSETPSILTSEMENNHTVQWEQVPDSNANDRDRDILNEPAEYWYKENSLFLLLGGMILLAMCCCVICVCFRTRQRAVCRRKSISYEVAWAYTPGVSDSVMISNYLHNRQYQTCNGEDIVVHVKGDEGSTEEEIELDSVQTDQCSHMAQFESPRERNHKSTFEQEMTYVVDCNESLMGHVVDDMVSSIQAKTVLGTLESQTEEL